MLEAVVPSSPIAAILESGVSTRAPELTARGEVDSLIL